MDIYIVTPSPDKLGDTVRDRILGAGFSDLLAVCTRYHRKCGKWFNAIPAPCINRGPECAETKSNADTLGALANDRVRIWSLLGVEFLCNSNIGLVLSKRTLLKKGIGPFYDKIFTLQSQGTATCIHYSDAIMSEMSSQITSVSIVCNRLFRRRSKKTSELRVIGLCDGNSQVTGEFPAHRASNAENVSIWWRHHVVFRKHTLQYLKPENYYMDGVALCLRKIVKDIITDSKGYQTLKGHFHIIQKAHRQAFNFTLWVKHYWIF